jgi:hypothetical protein
MSERKALIVAFDLADRNFFRDHGDREAHIRLPFDSECHSEFHALGDHQRTRRRILLWRVPKDSPQVDARKNQILKIPFLAFSDETIEDRDDILLPILHEIMMTALPVEGSA